MKTVNAIIAIAGAAVAGAVAGILLAPKKGSDTREDIKRFIKERCPFIKNDKLEEIIENIENS